MPKLKTHKGIKKRFRVTAKGKVVHRKANTSHLLSHKTTKRKRKLRRPAVVAPVEARRIRRALAGG